ncbi:ribose-phosphate pyrophosphokinase 1 [Exophiala xenobiotica]|nr:ribose-phosphate pyrophosphokinase 1 [Exophiala xenobiotica]KAK5191481.1 ribose-phosphate pyrophosphokinase 1 [Exophiala xenobiotica]KAK5207165.1 ribose-phosphate pyrophosphokinase 1 [Exophiala xenobiotica]KAK5218304.1 ribose-phosphate pyrophosphokinase 1 [Exophiala xenobiotica]KAK5264818.1 ribose-phosphate pyrophosphokinase 1 [Exophiala xenobiotica]
MRGVKVFSGRSHPTLVQSICERLGTTPAKVDLGNFANGEISVQIGTSVRNEDVFIVQSGSPHINDSVMEMLIMIAACKGGSAKSITAVIPYFPYSRQSKKKSHRGAVTAKMLANLMVVAGVDHVITVDLHASQMQGFFGKPVDNLFAEPIIARWIKTNVAHWKDAVVVSKNMGGTKRVTSLADALKLNFALVSTDRDRSRRSHHNNHMMDSTIFFDAIEPQSIRLEHRQSGANDAVHADNELEDPFEDKPQNVLPHRRKSSAKNGLNRLSRPKAVTIASSPLVQTTRVESSPAPPSPNELTRIETAPSARRPSEYEPNEALNDERVRDVIVGRLVHGHLVDDDHPSPALSSSASVSGLPGDHNLPTLQDRIDYDPMTASFVSNASSFQPEHALGGSFDAAATSDEEEEQLNHPDLEHTITLVGNVKDRTVILMDDIIDKSGSWIAAAETCVKMGHAKKVYCVAVHALFGDDSLEELEDCECIDHIVVTNTFPITSERMRESKKLIVIDLANLLAEAIRRNHHGEDMSTMFRLNE